MQRLKCPDSISKNDLNTLILKKKKKKKQKENGVANPGTRVGRGQRATLKGGFAHHPAATP
jgi:hypothetical protein